MAERTCLKCGESKPETTEFFRRHRAKVRGGLSPYCRPCQAAADRAYYRANREKYKAYRQAHAAEIAAYQAEYWKNYSRTPNGKAAIKRARERWKTAGGRDAIARAAQRRRARKRAVPSNFTAADWSACLEWFGQSCAYCGTDGELSRDHIVPITGGGGDVPENIIPACGSCNSRKWCKEMAPWFREQEFFDEERMMLILEYVKAIGQGG